MKLWNQNIVHYIYELFDNNFNSFTQYDDKCELKHKKPTPHLSLEYKWAKFTPKYQSNWHNNFINVESPHTFYSRTTTVTHRYINTGLFGFIRFICLSHLHIIIIHKLYIYAYVRMRNYSANNFYQRLESKILRIYLKKMKKR